MVDNRDGKISHSLSGRAASWERRHARLGEIRVRYCVISPSRIYNLTMTQSPPRIGTAGWSVPSLYLGKVPRGGSHLERYARHLNAVEINSSFHRPHRTATYDRWAQSTPDGFRFSVKVPKAITHEAGLVDCGALLDRFVEEVMGLGDKLSVLLIQLPPKSVFNMAVGDRFSVISARGSIRHSCWSRGMPAGLRPTLRIGLRSAVLRAPRPILRALPGPNIPVAGNACHTIDGMARRGCITRITMRRRWPRCGNA